MTGDFGRPHTWRIEFDDNGETLECRSLRKILWSLRPRIIPRPIVRWWWRFIADMRSEDACACCLRREWPWRRLLVMPTPGGCFLNVCPDDACWNKLAAGLLGDMTLEELEAMPDVDLAALLHVPTVSGRIPTSHETEVGA